MKRVVDMVAQRRIEAVRTLILIAALVAWDKKEDTLYNEYADIKGIGTRKEVWVELSYNAEMDTRAAWYCNSNKRCHSCTYKTNKISRIKPLHKTI